MRTQRWTTLAVVVGIAAATVASAQGPNGGLRMPASISTPQRAAASPIPAWTPAAAPGEQFVNAHGEALVAPMQYCGPVAGGGCYGDPMGGCYAPGGYGMPAGMDPFGGAYVNTEQCGPHWFDFSAEYLYYRRDDSGVSNVAFSTASQQNDAFDPPILGITGATPPGTPQLTDVALRLSDPVSDDLSGYRLTGRIDAGALSVVEFGYSGMYSGTGSASFFNPGSTGNFSIYSLYGTATNGTFGANGAAGIPQIIDVPTDVPAVPDNAVTMGTDESRRAGTLFNPDSQFFEETANAELHTLTHESTLQTAEVSFRRYWVGYNPRVSGTVMIGFRYTSLEEVMGFRSLSRNGLVRDVHGVQPVTDPMNPPSYSDDVPRVTEDKTLYVEAEASNYLSGIQIGGDTWICLVQGLRVGADGRIGLYANDSEYSTFSYASDSFPTGGASKAWSDTQLSFLTELRLSMIADIAPSVSLKAGYEVLFIENVTLAQDGLAFAQPYGDINDISTQLRSQSVLAGLNPVTTSGDVFYHGFHAGIEFVY